MPARRHLALLYGQVYREAMQRSETSWPAPPEFHGSNMIVDVELEEVGGFPRPIGPHELSWSYILDFVFSDAYHANVERLICVLPSKDLVDAVELRAELTPHKSGRGSGVAIADLAGRGVACRDYARTYALALGMIAPKRLRSQITRPLADTPPATTLSVFTLAARLSGIPLRAYWTARLPRHYDRASFAMRRRFTRSRVTPAYYHLYAWRLG